MKFVDITGLKYGRLMVINAIRGGHETKWMCVCDCGNNAIVTGGRLRSGDTRSCGCLRKETTAKKGHRNLKHGKSKDRTCSEYRIWTGMWRRCTNQNSGDWPGYGGRGITVCERWRSFEVFFADMGCRPPGTTLDRIDNNGNYEPGNCRWATKEEQNGNRRTSVILEYRGKRQSLSAWAREVGLHKSTISMRLRAGWSVEAALTRKLKEREVA
jgi:hypothetical protein